MSIVNRYNILRFLVLFICLGIFSGMDVRTPGTGRLPEELKYVPLQEGQGSFEARIVDEVDDKGNPKVVFDVKDVSFGGSTKLGGVRREDDDAMMILNISEIKEIQILKSVFQSQRYKRDNVPEEFILVKLITETNAEVNNVLIPKYVQISGIDKKTGLGTAWELSTLIKISFEPAKSTEKAIKEVNKALQETKMK